MRKRGKKERRKEGERRKERKEMSDRNGEAKEGKKENLKRIPGPP